MEALSAVKRADGVLNSGEDDTGELRRRVDAVRAELEAAERDRRMIARLEEARFQEAAAGKEGGFDNAGAAALYAAAFREDDMDLGLPWNRSKRRPASTVGPSGTSCWPALDEWVQHHPNQDEGQRLRGGLQAADPDPGSFRNRWNEAMAQRDWDTLEVLAINPEIEGPAAGATGDYGFGIVPRGLSSGRGEPPVKEANEWHPGDFWIIFELAYASLGNQAARRWTRRFAITPAPSRCVRAALAAHNNLGNSLRAKGQLDEAIAEFRQAIQIQPEYAYAHNNLGLALRDKHQLDEAIAEFRKALQIQPGLCPCPQQPRHRSPRQAPTGRGDRGIPQGPPNPARIRRGPQQPRQRPPEQGPAGRGDRGVP